MADPHRPALSRTNPLLHSFLILVTLGNAAVVLARHDPAVDAPSEGVVTVPDEVFRAFSTESPWNTPLGDAPVHPESDSILEFIRSDNDDGHLKFAGLDEDGAYGMPFYWPGPTDPVHHVANSCDYYRPPQFDAVRIPEGARPDASDDAHMTVVDRGAGIAYGFYEARFDDGEWTACGGSVWYLDSNGLETTVAGSDCTPEAYPPTGCRGHRGFPHPIHAVRLDEVRAGEIAHVLKIALDQTCDHVWPAAGDEGCDPGAPAEGTRLRIRADVDLEELGLSQAALVVARALQTYGAVVGDRSGGPAALKVEGCVAEGRGTCWDGVLEVDDLEALPFTPDVWEVVAPDHGRP